MSSTTSGGTPAQPAAPSLAERIKHCINVGAHWLLGEVDLAGRDIHAAEAVDPALVQDAEQVMLASAKRVGVPVDQLHAAGADLLTAAQQIAKATDPNPPAAS